ncbi:MAG: hypothetical protein J7M30_13715 [Deltaproteobacteria bacterium]|nr:hypothetical protein [Deltaproteobacteria bacterium]
MKKLFLLLIAGFFLSGCGTAAERSEFWKHDTMYKNTDHMLFSWFGYKTPTKETGKKSAEQKWWGEVIGAELEE